MEEEEMEEEECEHEGYLNGDYIGCPKCGEYFGND